VFVRLKTTLTFKELVLPCLLASQTALAEVVTGNAYYRYADNESLLAAREIALSMAQLDALELTDNQPFQLLAVLARKL
jgi:hypothetical protein